MLLPLPLLAHHLLLLYLHMYCTGNTLKSSTKLKTMWQSKNVGPGPFIHEAHPTLSGTTWKVHGANITLSHEEAPWIFLCVHRLHMCSSQQMHSLRGGVLGGVGGGVTGKVLGWYWSTDCPSCVSSRGSLLGGLSCWLVWMACSSTGGSFGSVTA